MKPNYDRAWRMMSTDERTKSIQKKLSIYEMRMLFYVAIEGLYGPPKDLHHTDEVEHLKAKNAALLGRITEFDSCIRQIAAELDSPCCGGVDGDQRDPHSTTAVLVDAIRKLHQKNDSEKMWKIADQAWKNKP